MNCFHTIKQKITLYKIIYFHVKALWGLMVLFMVLSVLVDTGASSQSTSTALERKEGLSHLCLLSGKCSFLKVLAH